MICFENPIRDFPVNPLDCLNDAIKMLVCSVFKDQADVLLDRGE